MIVYGLTDTGKRRERNEDCFFVSGASVGIFERLFVLADGMGGHSYGEVASTTAVQTVVSFLEHAPLDFPESLFEEAVSLANLEVQKKSDSKHANLMGTTLVIAGIINGMAYIANVGDSRCYLLNSIKGTITQITKDHSYVEEMVRKGLMERGSDAYIRQKNIITRAIGTSAETYPDTFSLRLQHGDLLLLCSDGLSNMVEDNMIRDLALDEDFTIEQRVISMIHTANDHGGRDNITVILADTEGRS